jgi:hypothetical protein
MGYGARQGDAAIAQDQMAKLVARVDATLEDYIEAAARAEGVPIDEYAGALLQAGWEAVFGIRRSERLPRAASASRQAELRARFVALRAALPHSGPLIGDDERAILPQEQANLDVSPTHTAQ